MRKMRKGEGGGQTGGETEGGENEGEEHQKNAVAIGGWSSFP